MKPRQRRALSLLLIMVIILLLFILLAVYPEGGSSMDSFGKAIVFLAGFNFVMLWAE